MDVLVVGATGLLGTDLVTALLEADHEVTGLGRDGLDVTAVDLDDTAALHDAVGVHDVVVNAAGLAPTAAAARPDEAFEVDAVGAQLLAGACVRTGTRLVHVSSADVVAAHPAGSPVPVTAPSRPLPGPQGAHGRAHAAGEWAVRASGADALVVRAGWLYGAHGACLPRTLAALDPAAGPLLVPAVWQRQPTWTVDVARVVVDLLRVGAPAGVYPATAMGWTDAFGLALEVWEALGRELDALEPVEDDEQQEAGPHGEAGHEHGGDPVASAEGVVPGLAWPEAEGWSVLAPQPLRRLGVEPVGPWRLRWAEAAPEVLADL